MKSWKVKSTAREQSREEVKILTCTFQLDSLSPLQFVIAMMTLNRKYTGGYKFTKSQEILCTWIITRYLQKKRKRGTGEPNINNKNIQLGYRNGTWH